MFEYEVYETEGEGCRKYPQGQFRHLEHANIFCNEMNKQGHGTVYYVRNVRIEDE